MKVLILISYLISFSAMANTNYIGTDQVSRYVGKEVSVCGKVVEIHSTSKGDTFINLDRPHPYQNFYFYIYNQRVNKDFFLNKTICRKGVVNSHKGKYQIILSTLTSN